MWPIEYVCLLYNQENVLISDVDFIVSINST